MMYEVALGSTKNRHILINTEDLFQWAVNNGEKQALYHSVYCYAKDDRKYMEGLNASEWKSIQRHIKWVPIDIDRGDDAAETTRNNAVKVVDTLLYLGLNTNNFKVFFSGRGYHIEVHEGVFDFMNVLHKHHKLTPSAPFLDLPYVVKETMLKLPGIGDIIDAVIYQRNGFIRAEHSLNAKSNLYKIQISIDELRKMTTGQIEELAKERRFIDIDDSDEYYGDGELSEYVQTFIPPVRSYVNVTEPKHQEACIFKMLTEGPVKGRRHNVILRIASYLKSIGIPSDYAKTILIEWNTGNLEDAYILELVEKCYNNPYKYGCNDKLRMDYCDIRCKHYKDKSVVETPDTFDQLITKFKKKDFLKEFEQGVDLAKMFGIDMGESDFIVTSGEVVSLLGMTKAGKSTLMKHIALGLSLTDMNHIHQEYKRNTIYYTGEEAPDYWLVVALMILENREKGYVLRNQNALIDKWMPEISHIMPLPTTAKMSGIKEHIEKYEAKQIILDTLDHFVDKSKGPAGIEQVMLELQNITTEYNIISYVVSQVGRVDARERLVKLFSGKGSGSIENQSRKVIGLSSTDLNRISNLELLANSYGASGQYISLQMYNSTRLRRITLPEGDEK